MAPAPAKNDGLLNGFLLHLVTNYAPFWSLLGKVPVVNSAINRLIINRMVRKMPPRPGRLSTMADYTSWDSLTIRRWSARHLARPAPPLDEPDLDDVVSLFVRDPAGGTPSSKSTLLFPYFAQWFVDGFLRTDPDDPRKNTSTHDIDLSQLYGQCQCVQSQLREGEGGRLWSQQIATLEGTEEEFPPYYYVAPGVVDPRFEGLEVEYDPGSPDRKVANAVATPDDVKRLKLFATGVPRGNIHPGFVMVHTLFLREHNRIAGELAAKHANDPTWDDERLFETTRNVLIVLLIKIVIEEYINHITPFHFDLFMEPGIGAKQKWHRQNWMSVEFNLLYRWHSLVPDIVRLGGEDRCMHTVQWDTRPVTENGLAALFAEASAQPSHDIGILNTPAFLLPVERASIGVGRAVGLASYNAYRVACGFPRAKRFSDVSSVPEVQEQLEQVYGSTERIELFVGLFAEDVREGAALPTLMGTMVAVDAFSQALTNPLLDPNVFDEKTFSPKGLQILRETRSLRDIVARNPVGGLTDDAYVSLTQASYRGG